jgi:hypothetical protein
MIEKSNVFFEKCAFPGVFPGLFSRKKTKKRSFYTPSYRKSQENANGY